MNLDSLETLVRTRRSTRHFLPDAIPEAEIDRLLDIARWAPSGYNLQPTHFFVVTNSKVRPALRRACMDQAQVEEAPVVIAFAGDRRVVENHFEEVLRLDREAGAIDDRYEKLLRKFVPLAFGHGPVGLGWLWKALLAPLGRLVAPIPSIPAVHKEYWLAKQVALCAMTFMLAAQAAGYATVPMEGFDEGRVRRVLGVPRNFHIPLVLALGRAVPVEPKKTRVPLTGILHRIE